MADTGLGPVGEDKQLRRRSLGRTGLGQGRRLARLLAIVFLTVYSLITLFPFYILFLRTFIPTKDSADLHLWIPAQEEISMQGDVNNLATFYNFNLKEFKQEMGIEGYISPGTTLQDLVDEYHVPEARLKAFFANYGVLNGWITLLGRDEFWNALLRSGIITVCSLLGTCALGIMTGYGLAGLQRRDQMIVYNLYLLEMAIPAMLIIVPQFLLVQGVQNWLPGVKEMGVWRWSVQLISIILIFIKGGAFTTMVFTSSIAAIPRELEESAQIDGSNRWQYLVHVLLPLLKVPIATVVVILLPDFWNRFLEPFIYLDPPNNSILPFIQTITGRYTNNFQLIFTAVLVSILPLVLIYLIFRHWFIRGAMSGAIKG